MQEEIYKKYHKNMNNPFKKDQPDDNDKSHEIEMFEKEFTESEKSSDWIRESI